MESNNNQIGCETCTMTIDGEGRGSHEPNCKLELYRQEITTLINVLTKNFTKYELKDGDVLIFTYNDTEIPINQIVHLRETLLKSHPNVMMIAVSNNIKIESFNEEKMNRFGWYSKKQVENFEEKIESFINQFGENTPQEVCKEILEQIHARREKRISLIPFPEANEKLRNPFTDKDIKREIYKS